MVELGDTSYLLWNNRIAHFWLKKPTTLQEMYLTITPSALAAAAFESDGAVLRPEEAENALVDAVKFIYRRRVLEAHADIACLATVVEGLPLCLAFLAASILAAYKMHADTENRATAYYVRLARLVDCPCVRELPTGISTEGFESLWLFVRDWAEKHLGKPLYTPKNTVVRKYVAYPLAHVGLRQVDLEKLPEFFEWADYAPGGVVAFERLRTDFLSWVGEGARLTRNGLAACNDDRIGAVLQQVAQELTTWNGAAEDMQGRGVAHVELTLDVVRGVPRLAYLARRPPGFPEVFEYGVHRFDSVEEGWYDPLPVPREDGNHLLRGFEWVSTRSLPRVALRRSGASVIAFVRSEEYSGFISRRRLLAGVQCALLYHASVEAEVHERIYRLVESAPTVVIDQTLPEGWRLLLDVKVDHPSSDTSPGLEALEVDAAVEFMLVGGLRVGRRAEWLVDRPPTLLVSGMQEHVQINGRPARVGASGTVNWDRNSRIPGAHVFAAGRTQRRINLVHAHIAHELPLIGSHENSFPVALEQGPWIIVGERPGQIGRYDACAHEILRLPFDPVWAFRQTSSGYALYIPTNERRPGRVEGNDTAAYAWAQTIKAASESNLPLASMAPAMSEVVLRSWQSFTRAALKLCQAQTERQDAEKSGAA